MIGHRGLTSVAQGFSPVVAQGFSPAFAALKGCATIVTALVVVAMSGRTAAGDAAVLSLHATTAGAATAGALTITLSRWSTDAERALWDALVNDRRLAGKGFKRQVPVGPHIADFVSFALRVVIDLAPEGESERAGRRECRWQRDQLPEAIRELVLDDQRLRNDICWSVFHC